MYFLDKHQREQVGFNFILGKLEVITPFGVDLKKNLRPYKSQEKEILLDELNNIDLILQNYNTNKSLYKNIERLLNKVKDIKNSIKRIINVNTLDDVELFEVKTFSLICEEICVLFSELKRAIPIKGIKFTSLKEVIDILDPDKKRIPTFYIYDSYSEKLKEIRAHKRKLEEQILLCPSAEKGMDLKGERLRWVVMEEEEELLVRRELTKKLNSHALTLERNILSIAKLDLLMAKAKLAINFNAVKPIITDGPKIHMEEAFNPEVSFILEARGKAFTPITLKIGSGVSVITGANMGGKSVTMKTVVLNLLLAHMGFFLFCKEATLPILDFIYFISDDLQSVSQGLSTFGAEIIDLKNFIEYSKNKTGFIALDEFARGTNPKEGTFLVKALCNYLNTQQNISLISTHYDNVVDETMVHYQVKGLKNVNFEELKNKINLNRTHSIEIIQEHMDYRLEQVSSSNKVPKDALNICILLGLHQDIIDIAQGFYSKEE